MSIRVVAHLSALPNKIEETKALLLSVLAPTRKETGCIRYELHQNNANPQDLTFIEEWDNDAALDAHLQTPHITAALVKVPSLLAGAPDIRRYTLVG